MVSLRGGHWTSSLGAGAHARTSTPGLALSTPRGEQVSYLGT